MLNSIGMAGRDVFDWKDSDEYHEAVIREYGKKMLKNPESFAFVSMANSCLKAGKVRMAADVLEKGMKHHPNLLSAHICKARILIETEKLDEAGEILQNIIIKKPEHLLARKLMAFVHLKKGRPEDGLAQIEKIREIEPNHEVPQVLHKKLLNLKKLQAVIEKHPVSDAPQQLLLSTLESWLSRAETMKEQATA